MFEHQHTGAQAIPDPRTSYAGLLFSPAHDCGLFLKLFAFILFLCDIRFLDQIARAWTSLEHICMILHSTTILPTRLCQMSSFRPIYSAPWLSSILDHPQIILTGLPLTLCRLGSCTTPLRRLGTRHSYVWTELLNTMVSSVIYVCRRLPFN
jgi:hypothetical protein